MIVILTDTHCLLMSKIKKLRDLFVLIDKEFALGFALRVSVKVEQLLFSVVLCGQKITLTLAFSKKMIHTEGEKNALSSKSFHQKAHVVSLPSFMREEILVKKARSIFSPSTLLNKAFYVLH